VRPVAPREVVSVSGDAVAIPDPKRLVHLQFRRFAGCPICNVHLQSIVRRHDGIVNAGVREVAVFHSTDEELRRYVGDLPFAVAGDPDKALYDEFGVGSSPRSLLHPAR
jgi:AhpC/TSA family